MKPGDSNAIARAYMDSLLIETRYIGSQPASAAVTILGEEFQTPVMTGALSHLNTMVHPGAMKELAAGAKEAGVLMWMGMAEPEETEECASTGARIIEIIKPYEDREEIRRKIRQAEELGLTAVGVDIDFVYDPEGKAKVFHGHPLKELSAEELTDLCHDTRLPFLVKGVLSTRDALLSARAGAAGLMVSHHGGSIEDALPPLYMLPLIRQALAEAGFTDIPLFLDCEIQGGRDVFKALALGATAVSIGRPLMEAIREKGAPGVTEYLQKTTGSLRKYLAATGSPDPSHIDSTVIHVGLGDVRPDPVVR